MGLIQLFLVAVVLLLIALPWALIRAMRMPQRLTYGAAMGRGFPTDPADVGMTAEAVTFRDSDDNAAPGWILPGKRPDGPDVVVTHGFNDSRYRSLLWAPLLAEHASRVILYDMRGHGDSAAQRSHCGLREPQDLLGILDQLPPREMDAGVVLLGLSIGGGVSIVAAADDPVPDRVLGVIADGPYRLWDEPLRCILRSKRYPNQPVLALTWLFFRIRFRQAFAEFDRAGHAARLRCPLLVVHAEGDHICPIASGQAIADAAAEGECIVFPEGCHMDLHLRDPERYADALDRFFTIIQRPCSTADRM